jgi:drug/metabolite transporter (DMT)-like permease
MHNNRMQNQRKSYLAAFTAVLLWSTIAVAFKKALQYLDPLQVVFLSSLVSFLFFMVLNLMKGGIRQVLYESTVREKWRSAWLGALNPFLYYIILMNAYDKISAQEAMTLNYIWPLMLAILSVPLLRQKLGIPAFLAMLISFSGLILIATKGNLSNLDFSNLQGDFLAAGSSVIWALYWIFNLKDQREILQKLQWNFFFGTLYSLVVVLLFSKTNQIPLYGWLSGLYLGLFEMGVTFLLWLTALKLTRKTYLISQLIFIAPFLSLIWIRIFLLEKVLPVTLAGLVLIVTGIIILQWSEQRRNSTIR